MLTERLVGPAFSIYLYCKSLPDTAQAQSPGSSALLRTLVRKEWYTYSRSSIGKTMPRVHLRQDYFKIMFCITEEV